VRAPEWKKASQPLAAVLPGFEPFKWGFVRQHEWIAECISMESHSFSRTRIYIWAFALPLFVPTNHVYFTYGDRVGHFWEGVTPELVDAVAADLPTLRELATLDGVIQRSERPDINIHHAELHLCAALIQGKRDRFERLAQAIEAWDADRDYEHEIIRRCADLAGIVEASGIDAAVAVLRERIPVVMSLFR
jgi:hypothetical protein